MKKIAYVSDGALTQFKNNKSMFNLIHHSTDFGLPASWTFSATAHGKGPVDGIGAAVKSVATRYLRQRTAVEKFLTPKAFYEYVKSFFDSRGTVELLFVEGEEVDATLKTLDDRWKSMRDGWVVGIRDYHQFDPRGNKMICRPTSTSQTQRFFVM